MPVIWEVIVVRPLLPPLLRNPFVPVDRSGLSNEHIPLALLAFQQYWIKTTEPKHGFVFAIDHQVVNFV